MLLNTLLLTFMVISKQVSVDAQFGFRKFGIDFSETNTLRLSLLMNLIKEQRIVEMKRKEIEQKKVEEIENVRRRVYMDSLYKRIKGNKAILKDFYSRF